MCFMSCKDLECWETCVWGMGVLRGLPEEWGKKEWMGSPSHEETFQRQWYAATTQKRKRARELTPWRESNQRGEVTSLGNITLQHDGESGSAELQRVAVT